MNNLKIPPSDVDAERSILGIILLDNSKFMDIVDVLEVNDFYDRNLRTIYGTMKKMFAENIPVDFVSLKDKLKVAGKLEDIGGIKVISKLADDVASTVNMKYYADIVKEKSRLRRLIIIGNNLMIKGFKGEDKSDAIKNEGFDQLMSISEAKKRQLLRIDYDLEGLKEEISRKAMEPEIYGSLLTGLGEFDSLTGGFDRQEVVIIAGRPSMGKTALMVTIANYMGVNKARGVLIFSLDQSFRILQKRLLAQLAKVDSMILKKGTYDKKTIGKIRLLEDIPIYVDDNPMNIDTLCSLAHKYCSMHSIKAIFVDYIQLLDSSIRTSNRNEKVTDISNKLKGLAKSLDLVIFELSQLSRAGEKEKRRPIISDLRDSGSLEQDASYVIFPYSENFGRQEKKDDFNPANYEDVGIMDLILAKNKEGPTGEVKVRLLKQYGLFECLEE